MSTRLLYLSLGVTYFLCHPVEGAGGHDDEPGGGDDGAADKERVPLGVVRRGLGDLMDSKHHVIAVGDEPG